MSSIVVAGDTSGSITLQAPAVAGTNTLTLPASTGTVALLQTPSFATTIGVGGATPSASGAGITFPATQSASTDANTLDDYEEGTWTPSLTFGGGSTGLTYNTRNGTYTKVGNVVTIRCYFALSAKGSSTGAAVLGGLPFTTIAVSNNYQCGSVYGASMTGLVGALMTYSAPTTTSFNLGQRGSAGFSSISDAVFTNTTDFMLQVSYITN